MRSYAHSLLIAGLLAGGVSAQCDPCGPGKTEDVASKCLAVTAFDTYTNPPIYLSPAPTRKWIVQIKTVQPRGAIRMVNGSQGPITGSKYLTYMTVYGVDTIYGNTSQNGIGDFMVGGAHDRERDQVVGCWTPAFLQDPCAPANTIAEAFRTNLVSAGNFGLMVEAALGREGVADHSDGPVYFNRPTVNQAFGNYARISSVTTTYVDPEIESRNVSGQTIPHLWWVAADAGGNPNLNRIVCAPLDTSTYSRCGSSTVTTRGNAVTYVVPCQSSQVLVVNVHSPTVITDAQGTAIGMLLSERVGNDSDEFWKPNLTVGLAGTPHPQTGPFFNNTAWTNNGGEAGGTMYYANSASPFYDDVHLTRGFFLSGGTDAKGAGGAVFKVNMDNRNAGTANVAILLLGLAGRIPPTAIGGFEGTLCLNPAVLPLGVIAMNEATEIGFQSLPDLSALGPVSAPVQALGIDTAGGGNPQRLIFSNIDFLDVL